MSELAQTFHDLVRVETRLWNGVDRRLREECDLTLARFETMQVIGRSGPCRVLDIAGGTSHRLGRGQQDRRPSGGGRPLPPPPEPRRRAILIDHSDAQGPSSVDSGHGHGDSRTATAPRRQTHIGSTPRPELRALAPARRRLTTSSSREPGESRAVLTIEPGSPKGWSRTDGAVPETLPDFAGIALSIRTAAMAAAVGERFGVEDSGAGRGAIEEQCQLFAELIGVGGAGFPGRCQRAVRRWLSCSRVRIGMRGVAGRAAQRPHR